MSRPAVGGTRPNIWWVNQGKTFKLEFQGGYIWAPLRDQRGATPPHWRRMEEVRPGDIVLHYSDGFLRAVSRVQTAPQQAVYPEEAHGKYGGRVGTLIRAEYHLLDPQVPRDVAWRLEHLPPSEGPFTDAGSVQQGYLFRFSFAGLVELVASFDSNWPQWLSEQLNETAPPFSMESTARLRVLADLEAVVSTFAEALERSHLRFDRSFVRTFVSSLAAKRFAILTGLSGAGKTQLAAQFGRWLGRGRMLLVPVRPDWTSSDALLGYEDALRPPADDGRRAWHVPEALRFMLAAARDPNWPYLLILDEMNLSHVERYFADVLSGMESGESCVPNVAQDDDGSWRLIPGAPEYIPVPRNLFVVGTVNVDETTYMFSPKVLDRANTLEFRVTTDDLSEDLRKPVPCGPGPESLVRGFLELAKNADWHVEHPHPEQDALRHQLKELHRILYEFGFEFGHRVFVESVRFAAMLAAAGDPGVEAALDAIVMQKILPRLHGNRRRLESVLEAVGAFAFFLDEMSTLPGDTPFDPMQPPSDVKPRLPRSFAKVRRMMANLRANQFTSFAEQ